MGVPVIFLLLTMTVFAKAMYGHCHSVKFCNAFSHLQWQSKDWVLAFRLTAGAQQSAYKNYVDKCIDDDHPLSRVFLPKGCLQNSGDCDRHYHSSLLNHWPSRYVDQVRVTLFKGGKEVAFVLFNGKNSDYISWFAKNRVISSSWNDIKTATSNIFSIKGHGDAGHARRFLMFHKYGGCPRDDAWMSVQDQLVDGCAWGRQTSKFPAILYSNQKGHAGFYYSKNVDRADVMTITVKLNLPCEG